MIVDPFDIYSYDWMQLNEERGCSDEYMKFLMHASVGKTVLVSTGPIDIVVLRCEIHFLLVVKTPQNQNFLP